MVPFGAVIKNSALRPPQTIQRAQTYRFLRSCPKKVEKTSSDITPLSEMCYPSIKNAALNLSHNGKTTLSDDKSSYYSTS